MRSGAALLAALLVVGAAAFVLGLRTGAQDPLPTPDLPADGVDVDSPTGTFSIDARGVQTETTLEGVRNLHLRGSFVVDLPVGALEGDTARSGGLRITGGEMRLEGDLTMRAVEVVVRANDAVLHPRPIGIDLVAAGDGVVSGDSVVFAGPDGESQLSGPVRFTSGGRGRIRLDDEDVPLRWLDPPARIEVSSPGRTFLSWAGEGNVSVDGRSFDGPFGRVTGRDLEGTIVRDAGTVRCEGGGTVQQVYLDGVPQLRTQATVDEVRVRRNVAAGESSRFTWAPRNLGDFDMVMTRIRPASEPARWLSFGLAAIDPVYGGEERSAVGGVTDGFRRGRHIRPVIAPFGADRRDITVSVPRGAEPGTYLAEVVVEGNFDPVSITFEIVVE